MLSLSYKGSLPYFPLTISDWFCGLLIQHHSYVFEYYISCHTLWGWLTNFVRFWTPGLPVSWKSLQLIHSSGTMPNCCLYSSQLVLIPSQLVIFIPYQSAEKRWFTEMAWRNKTILLNVGGFSFECCPGKFCHQFNNWEIPALVPVHLHARGCTWRLPEQSCKLTLQQNLSPVSCLGSLRLRAEAGWPVGSPRLWR